MKADLGEPTAFDVLPFECCGPRFSLLLVLFLRSFGEGVLLAGDVLGELRGLRLKGKRHNYIVVIVYSKEKVGNKLKTRKFWKKALSVLIIFFFLLLVLR